MFVIKNSLEYIVVGIGKDAGQQQGPANQRDQTSPIAAALAVGPLRSFVFLVVIHGISKNSFQKKQKAGTYYNINKMKGQGGNMSNS